MRLREEYMSPWQGIEISLICRRRLETMVFACLYGTVDGAQSQVILELGFKVRIGKECAAPCCGDGGAGTLLHAALDHAVVRRFHHGDDAEGTKALVDGASYLLRHAFLNLQPASEDVHHTGKLGKPGDDATVRVGDVR